MSLGSAVQNPPPGPPGLLGHKRYLQPVLAEALSLPRHRGGGDLQSIRNSLVGPAIGAFDVGLEQDAPVEQPAGVCPAATDERFELPRSSSVRRTTFSCTWREPRVLLMPRRVKDRVLLLNLSVTED